MEEYAQTKLGRSLARLKSDQLRALATELSTNSVDAKSWPDRGIAPGQVWRTVLAAIHEGVLAEPAYGANYGRAGWEYSRFQTTTRR
jgi:hypothetical protein